MKQIPATETPIIEGGVLLGILQKYYKYGLWHYRAIIQRPNGFISGNFYDKSTAIKFIQKNKEVKNGTNTNV